MYRASKKKTKETSGCTIQRRSHILFKTLLFEFPFVQLWGYINHIQPPLPLYIKFTLVLNFTSVGAPSAAEGHLSQRKIRWRPTNVTYDKGWEGDKRPMSPPVTTPETNIAPENGWLEDDF